MLEYDSYHYPHFPEAGQSSGRVWQSGFSYDNSDREYSEWEERMECGWFLTPYPADLDPLDGTPRHLSHNLLDPNAKDPSAWSLRGL